MQCALPSALKSCAACPTCRAAYLTPQVDHGYHGHTSLCIDLSPYKWKGPGGSGRPAYVHVLPCPDGAPFAAVNACVVCLCDMI